MLYLQYLERCVSLQADHDVANALLGEPVAGDVELDEALVLGQRPAQSPGAVQVETVPRQLEHFESAVLAQTLAQRRGAFPPNVIPTDVNSLDGIVLGLKSNMRRLLG